MSFLFELSSIIAASTLDMWIIYRYSSIIWILSTVQIKATNRWRSKRKSNRKALAVGKIFITSNTFVKHSRSNLFPGKCLKKLHYRSESTPRQKLSTLSNVFVWCEYKPLLKAPSRPFQQHYNVQLNIDFYIHTWKYFYSHLIYVGMFLDLKKFSEEITVFPNLVHCNLLENIWPPL